MSPVVRQRLTQRYRSDAYLRGGLPKHVVSTTLARAQWNNSFLIQSDVAEEVAKLKRQPGNELQVHGSAALVRTLMKPDDML